MNKNIKQISTLGMLAAVATILMYIELPLPLMPPFFKLDISTSPALIGGFLFGPVGGILIALVKALIHALTSQTGGVGELADFLCSGTIILISSLIYKKHKTKKRAVCGLCIGVAGLIIVSALANMYILIPFYSQMMPIEQIFQACNAVNPLINSKLTYILWGVVPFNLFKGILISLLTMLLYKKISHIVKEI